jgi:hypothetical protein
MARVIRRCWIWRHLKAIDVTECSTLSALLSDKSLFAMIRARYIPRCLLEGDLVVFSLHLEKPLHISVRVNVSESGLLAFSHFLGVVLSI